MFLDKRPDCRCESIRKKWFFDKAGTRIYRALLKALSWIAGDDDGGARLAALAQSLQKRQSVHTGKSIIEDKARWVGQVMLLHQGLTAGERFDHKPFEFERELQRGANGRIVVDEYDQRGGIHQLSLATSVQLGILEKINEKQTERRSA